LDLPSIQNVMGDPTRTPCQAQDAARSWRPVLSSSFLSAPSQQQITEFAHPTRAEHAEGSQCQNGWVARSEEISRAFYARLGAAGLANRTRPEWDQRIIDSLIELLPPRARVLDVGCGYGRIALPLARTGHDVHGLDHSPNLVEAARMAADADGIAVGLSVGSMTNLPYRSGSFDALICLWSAFFELLEETEQVEAIGEMWRVLRPKGLTLIEGPVYRESTDEETQEGIRRGPEGRIAWIHVEGILKPGYRHDERSFARVCQAAGISDFNVFERDWGGRERLFLRLDKPPS